MEVQQNKSTRPKRQHPKFKRQKSFTDALKEKYLEDYELSKGSLVVNISYHGKPKTNGSDAELAYLRNVVLNEVNVGYAGLPSSGLASICPNVVDLDIARNDLNDWSEVLSIWCELPCLKFVNISGNKLINKQNTLESWNKTLPKVENLVLNNIGAPWEEVLLLCKHLPQLKELHVCHNGYEGLSEEDYSHMQSLKCLRMNNNAIQSWEEVWKLRFLPELESLILSGNPLEKIFYEDNPTKATNEMVEQEHKEHLKEQEQREQTGEQLQEQLEGTVDQEHLERTQDHDNEHLEGTHDRDNEHLEGTVDHGLIHKNKTEDQEHEGGTNISNDSQQIPDVGSIREDAQEVLNNESLKIENYSPIDITNDDKLITKEGVEENLRTDEDSVKDEQSCLKTDDETVLATNPVGMVTDKQNVIATDEPSSTNDEQHNQNDADCSSQNENLVAVVTEGSDSNKELDDEKLCSKIHEIPCDEDSVCDNICLDNDENVSQTQDPAPQSEANDLIRSNDNCTSLSGANDDEVDDKEKKTVTEADKQSEDVAVSGPKSENTSAASGAGDENVSTDSCSDEKKKPFAKLKSLCVSDTKLSDWTDLQALSLFPALTNLRCQDIILISDLSQEDKRKMKIASLPNIKTLNGSEILATEREKAERHYIRYFHDKDEKPERVVQLEAKHGKLEPVQDIDISKGFKRWIDLTFVKPGETFFKDKVDVIQTVGKLKQMLRKRMGSKMSYRSLTLWHMASGPYHTEEDLNTLSELTQDGLPLSRYDVMDGDEIHIEDEAYKFKPTSVRFY